MKQLNYFDAETLREDLKGKAVRGGISIGIVQVVEVLITLSMIPVISRLLTPEAFGLVAMVGAITGFGGMFVDAGLSMATVQRRSITHQQVSNLFWVASGLGIMVGGIIAACSPMIAWFYEDPRLVAITLALCTPFVASGLTIQHQALLRRAMQFKRLAIVQIAATLSGVGIAIGWAYMYQSYWALILLPICSSIVRMIGTWMVCSWHPSLPKRSAGMRSLIGFGANLTGFELVNYFARNMDNILIGWYWGAAQLGFYERAYRILLFPLQRINGPISGIAIPTLSRVIHEPQRYRKIYIQFLQLILVVTVPLVAFLYVTRDWCVHFLLGAQWAPVVPIFAWLSLAAFIQPISNTMSWLFISQGRTREMFYWGIVGALSAVASFIIGLSWGPHGVAAAYAISGLLFRLPVLSYWATRHGPIALTDLMKALPLPILLGCIVFLSLSLLRLTITMQPSSLSVFVGMIVAFSAWILVMLATKEGRRMLSFIRISLLESLQAKIEASALVRTQ